MTEEKKKLGDEVPDEETQQILDEIKEEEEEEKTKSEEETKVEEESKDEDKKDSEKDEDKKDEDKESKDTSKINKRSVRSVPYGRFAKEKEKRERLEKDFEDLKSAKEEEKKGGEKVDMQESFKEIAESLSVEPEVVEKMYNAFAKLSGGKKEPEIKPEILEKIDGIDKVRQKLDWQYEDRQFVKEFKRDILPVLKERYPDISRQGIVKAMRKLHTIAFSEAYHLVPKLKSVFLGVPDEFGFLEGKKGGEGGKSAGTAKKGGKDLTHELTEEEMDKLTDEEFDKYTDNMAKLKGGSRLRVTYRPK